LNYYQKALEIEATNARAISGIQSIVKNYTDKTIEEIEAGRYDVASGYLATASIIDPNNSSIGLLQKIISAAKPLVADLKESNRPVNAKPTHGVNTPARSTASPGASAKSDNRTPATVAREQELFDQQYLQRGLNAYYKGEYDTAAALLQPLADKGVSRAQFRIAYMYYRGRGFAQDKSEADRIARAALPSVRQFAEQGRSWAQSDLGSLYEDGLVLAKDYAYAIYWYRSAAEQGYAGAQTNLGIMYADGRGVATSRQTAIAWFQKAAAQGDALAKRNLVTMQANP
jgi:TPR repeat protein